MKNILIIFLLFTSIGCEVKLNTPVSSYKLSYNTPVTKVSQTISDEVKEVAESMEAVSKEDCEIAAKQFLGISEYMKHTKKINSTVQMWKIIDDFQKDYGWTREKYKDYSDVIDKYLTERGYKVPKVIDDSNRQSYIDDMEQLGLAAKIALEKKNAK